jgi:hypothetical protein
MWKEWGLLTEELAEGVVAILGDKVPNLFHIFIGLIIELCRKNEGEGKHEQT